MIWLGDSGKQPKQDEVGLPGLTDLSGLGWVADGSGWFVTINTTIGVQLIFVNLDGRWQSLGDIQGWAVPSPDGKRLAYLNKIVAANAWVIERR